MSIKKKIFVSYFISAFIIAILAIFEYLNFIEIKKEIRNLELTDTIRSKSLQLRRHEKNFFLFGMPEAQMESEAIHEYLRELNAIIVGNIKKDKTGRLTELKGLISVYTTRFNKIELSIKSLNEEFERLKPYYHRYENLFPMLESVFPERPLQVSEFLEKVFLLPSNHNLVVGLRNLYSDIQSLRKDGEEIINISRELDRFARKNAEDVIRTSQIAVLVFFPVFLIIGIALLFIIGNNVVNRLRLLVDFVERTGKGDYSHIPVSHDRDEVGILISKFNDMENQLSQREEELQKKNIELLQSRKLAAIGTLASGVAHELNNPLNNIYISAQVLMREISNTSSVSIKETVNDILGQTLRVKGIVGDLLEFARGKEPRLKEVLLNDIIMGAYKFVSTTTDTGNINFMLHSQPSYITINVDPEQMERVFVNLFLNAIDAMNGKGNLDVHVIEERGPVMIKISDEGRGIPKDALEKIFEPFYTTKDKGTGLGLAIVFNIIKKHNGEIIVESEEGRGTTFTITLPRRSDSEKQS